MHHGCVAGANEGGEGAAGWWPTSPSCRWGGRQDTRELATDHQAYLSGHGESPGRWYGAGASTLGLRGEVGEWW
jgi:hypothetical protein